MIVFRYLEERELIGILNKETSNIGSHFPKTNSNTFKYKDNEKYLHFYKKAEDMIHIRKIHCKNDVKSRKPGSFYYCAYSVYISMFSPNIRAAFTPKETFPFEFDCKYLSPNECTIEELLIVSP